MFDEDILAGMSYAPPGADGESGVRVQLRLPWYRSLPLSCIEGLTLSLDGGSVPAEEVAVIVGGQPQSLASVAALHDVLWFVLDTIDVQLRPGVCDPGRHRVGVTMNLRIPYGDQDYRIVRFTQVARCERELTLQRRSE